MKPAVCLLLCVIISACLLGGCANQSPADLRPMVCVEGVLYVDTGKAVPVEIDPSAILGTIGSSVDSSEIPTENGQSNFGSVGAEYAFCEDYLVVMLNDEWYRFDSEKEQSDALHDLVSQWTVTDGITLRLMNSRFPEGVEKMTLVMENRTDNVMLYGNGWSFEQYNNGKWIPLQNKENVAFTAEGYTLYDHRRDVFHISTFALEKPLTEGLYRVTGCSLRVASDDENLSYGGNYTDYPPYKLEFAVKKDALPDRGLPEEPTLPGGLAQKEDWEWYTPWESVALFEGIGQTVWQLVQGNGDDGLVALLCRPDTPENQYLEPEDKLSLHLFDRRTGRILTLFDTLSVEQDHVLPGEQGGFLIVIEEDQYYAGMLDGEWVLEGPETQYALRTESAVYPIGTQEIAIRLSNHTGEHAAIRMVPVLERMCAEGWEPMKTNAGFCGTPDPFPTEGRDGSIDLGIFQDISAGTYRVSMTAVDNAGTEHSISDIFILENR